VLFSHGRLRGRDGRHKEALEWSRAGLKHHPEDTTLLMDAGLAEAQCGHHGAALCLFERVVAKHPVHEQAWHEQGKAYLALTRFEKAISCFRKVLVVDPQHFGSMEGLGHAYRHKGDAAMAKQCYVRCTQLNPTSASACNNLANELAFERRFSEALRWFQVRRVPGRRCAFASVPVA